LCRILRERFGKAEMAVWSASVFSMAESNLVIFAQPGKSPVEPTNVLTVVIILPFLTESFLKSRKSGGNKTMRAAWETGHPFLSISPKPS